ncbi:hypothetical protein, partial [Streptomyces sp. E2N166]|uniref:hypothetical protein n=1 Tax=Streptomyces sp. E2N166 TaxID=1851909 RepID=UPI001292BAD2
VTGRDGPEGASDDDGDFTAERAASSLAGFRSGTLRAQADDAEAGATDTEPDEQVLSSAAPSTPTAERRPPTKDSR